MVTRNKKLVDKLNQKKNQASDAAPVDPKGKKAPPPAKKEEPAKGKDPKAKGGPTAEEEQAEAERLK